LNRSKRPLRSTLQALTAALTEAILAAARESLFDLADSQRAEAPRKKRVGARAPKKARVARVTRAAEVESLPTPAFEAASDQVITDPQALLAALASSPELADEYPPEERELPELLLPAEVPAAREIVFVPSLRAGEEIMRSSGSNVVLRRRRM
jgi:hypothetical protein